jgi:pimeloyl-ACP methyl ester carboxylesterase
MHMPKIGRPCSLAVLAAASVAEAQQPASLTAKTSAAGTTRGSAKATIVLVHGAFADATGWQLLIAMLQQDGYKVVAVQNTMASLAGDVETTKLLIDAQSGPMVVRALSPHAITVRHAVDHRPIEGQ